MTWEVLRLGDAMTVKHGFAFPGRGFTEDPSRPQVLSPGNFALDGSYQPGKPRAFDGAYPSEFLLSGGAVVVTMTDLSKNADTLGFATALPPGEYLHNQRIGLVKITAPKRLDERYFAYLSRTAEYRSYIIGTASGSTVRHTSPGRIENYSTAAPPLDEQRAIAAVLTALDDKIAANTRIADTAHQLAQGLFNRAASAAQHRALSSFTTPVLGATPSRSVAEYWGGDIPWASVKDIGGAVDGVITKTAESISQLAGDSTRARPMPAGTVLLSARGTVGEVARLMTPAAFNQSCYGFAPGAISPAVLYFTIRVATARAKAYAHGSVFDTITLKTFDSLEAPYFERDLMAEIEAEIAPLLATVDNAVVQSQTLADLRDALLPGLMSGKLRVSDIEKAV